jgi:hypothetical protein
MNKWVIPCTYNLELLQGPTIKNGSLIIIKTKNRGGGRVDKWTIGCLGPNIRRIFACVKWVTANWKNGVYNIICIVYMWHNPHTPLVSIVHIIDVKWIFFFLVNYYLFIDILLIFYFL